MSGRGVGGRGLGMGGAKRHRKVLRDNIQGITKPAIRRLARRGGVKRISGLIYEETRGILKVFLEHVIRDAVTYTTHARRKTVTAVDVVHALKRQGRTLYGFGGIHSGAGVEVRPKKSSKKKKQKQQKQSVRHPVLEEEEDPVLEEEEEEEEKEHVHPPVPVQEEEDEINDISQGALMRRLQRKLGSVSINKISMPLGQFHEADAFIAGLRASDPELSVCTKPGQSAAEAAFFKQCAVGLPIDGESTAMDAFARLVLQPTHVTYTLTDTHNNLLAFSIVEDRSNHRQVRGAIFDVRDVDEDNQVAPLILGESNLQIIQLHSFCGTKARREGFTFLRVVLNDMHLHAAEANPNITDAVVFTGLARAAETGWSILQNPTAPAAYVGEKLRTQISDLYHNKLGFRFMGQVWRAQPAVQNGFTRDLLKDRDQNIEFVFVPKKGAKYMIDKSVKKDIPHLKNAIASAFGSQAYGEADGRDKHVPAMLAPFEDEFVMFTTMSQISGHPL